MTKPRRGRFPVGTRMRSLELSTGGEYPEARFRDWQRRCSCGPPLWSVKRPGVALLGGQTPDRVYRGTPVCARCQSFIWVHGAPVWN